jgi:hypothetical protein
VNENNYYFIPRYSPAYSAEVKNAWSYTSTPPYVFMEWCLVKYGDNFTVTFTFISRYSTIHSLHKPFIK